jgi:uncharacterized protein (DUF433 family)
LRCGAKPVLKRARDGLLVKMAGHGKLTRMNNRIVIDPRICHGKPVIHGTRMPVALVIGSLAGGMSFEEVEREYGLTRDDIRAALKFAGELIDQEEHHPLPVPSA